MSRFRQYRQFLFCQLFRVSDVLQFLLAFFIAFLRFGIFDCVLRSFLGSFFPIIMEYYFEVHVKIFVKKIQAIINQTLWNYFQTTTAKTLSDVVIASGTKRNFSKTIKKSKPFCLPNQMAMAY